MTIAPSREAGFDLTNWLRVLVRGKFIIAGCVVLSIAVAAVLTARSTPGYLAVATVALNVQKVQISPLDTIVSSLPREGTVLRTELDFLNSRMMAERVANKLGLGNQETNSAASEETRSALGDLLQAQLLRFGMWVRGEVKPTDLATALDPKEEVINELLSGLDISNDGRSYTIYLAYTASDPILAAKIANGYAEAYLEQQVEFKRSTTHSASEWLGKKLVDLRAQLASSEMTLETFRRTHGLMEANGRTPQAVRMTELNTQLSLGRASRAAAEARYHVALERSRGGEGLDGFPEAVGSPVIEALRSQLSDLQSKLLQVKDFGAYKDTQRRTLAEQIAGVQQQITEAQQQVLTSLVAEVEVASRKESELRLAVTELENELKEPDAAIVQIKQLEREAAANRTIYESFLARYKQTVEQEGLAYPDARLISPAKPPQEAPAPLLPLLAIATLFGLGAGGALVIIRERLDTSVRRARSIEEITTAPVIGALPLLPSRRFGSIPMQPVADPSSRYALAVRQLSTTLLLSPLTERAKVYAITSSAAREGKTSVVVSVARSIAISGRSVVVVDANFRNPRVAAAFRVAAAPSLNHLVSEVAEDEEIARQDPHSTARLVSAAVTKEDSNLLLGSAKFADLLQRLRARFDVVILDTPPLMKSADAGLIGSYADATIMVVRWGKTSRQRLLTGIRQLGLWGISVTGIVINAVPSSRMADCEVETAYAQMQRTGATTGRPKRLFPVPRTDDAARVRARPPVRDTV